MEREGLNDNSDIISKIDELSFSSKPSKKNGSNLIIRTPFSFTGLPIPCSSKSSLSKILLKPNSEKTLRVKATDKTINFIFVKL